MISSKNECKISLKLDKLSIPLLELTECIIDLSYEDKRIRFKYPHEESQIIPLTEIINTEKQIIKLTIMIIVGKKYKKIARGEINIYRKYCTGDKKPIQKWLYLTLFQTQLENMGHKSDIIKAELNTGKIQMDLVVLDSIDIKKKAAPKDPIQANKTERFRSIVENSNEFLKKIKQKKETEILEELFEDISPEKPEKKEEVFEDGLSDLSISIIDGNEDEKEVIDLTELINDKFHNQLKELFNVDCEAILPKDPSRLKEMNEMLYAKFKELSESYEKTLTAMNVSNERMRLQAKDFYEKYKEIKKEVYKERVGLREKNSLLKSDITANKEKNAKLSGEVQELKTEVDFFKTKMNIVDSATTVSPQVEDINSMSEILRSVHNMGFDIFTGLSSEQKKQLMALINVEEHEEEKHQNLPEEIQNDKEDIDLGNQVVTLIEKVVNDLFPKNFIVNIKIDQINAITYSFSDDFHAKEITLKISNGNLITESGESFNAWLIANFGKR